MLLALTAIASISLGYEISRLLWREHGELSWAERLLYASIIGVALWLASTWSIALLDVLVRPAVITRSAAFVVAAAALRLRRGAGSFRALVQRELNPRVVRVFGLALLPLFLWCIFILWRCTIVPALSHDALAYHLPKAALWVQAEGYDPLDRVAFMIGPRPSNYEMLLADAILLDGKDTYTEWLSTIFYLLFVVASIATAHRWWGDDPVTTVAMALLVGGVPVLLLQSGAHKNDVMTAYFIVAGAVAAGRWITATDLRALTISGVAFAAAAGTKQHGPVLAIFLLPFMIGPFLRARWNVRRVAVIAIVAVLAFALLGAGPHYLDRHPDPVVTAQSDPTTPSKSEPVYGDWSNLWIGPWVLLTGPFSGRGSIFVPGHGSWYWRRYEIYFSHLGLQFVIAVLLLFFAIARYRRSGSVDAQRERVVITIATAGAFFTLLPIHSVPFGIYVATLPRFVLFIVPVIFSWAFAPFIRELAQRSFTRPLLASAAIFFTVYAVDNALNDAFVPASYVDWARRNPGTRVIPFDPNRPASIVDRAAAPHDVIAVDGGASTWTYPAFGAALTRRVILLPPPASGVAPIPDEAKWVIFDRSWSVIWGDPRFRSLSQSAKLLSRGQAPAKDVEALERLRSDERFVTVVLMPRTLQGVFMRRPIDQNRN